MKSMAKPKENRFEGFEVIGDQNSDPKLTIKPQQNKRSVEKIGKSADPDFKKVTLYLSKELHLLMKSHTLTTEENMSDLVERIMTDYFKQLDS